MAALDRYVSATRSSNLSVDERTTMSDSDMLGAMGLASKRNPLAAALARLYAGHNHAVAGVVTALANELTNHRPARELTRLQCEDLSRAVLAWHRDGVCKPCGGHGHTAMPGAPVLSGNECRACAGAGRIKFERNFRERQVPVARWLLNRVESEVAGAGTALHSKLGG
jgi:hypothetical protein